MESRELLEHGTRWMVGGRTRIKIWKDKWLLRHHGVRVWSPIMNPDANATAHQLKDTDTRSWNAGLLNSTLYPFEVEQITDIPISWKLPEDKLIWHYSRDGKWCQEWIPGVYFQWRDGERRKGPVEDLLETQYSSEGYKFCVPCL